MNELDLYLKPTPSIDYDNSLIAEKTRCLVNGAQDAREIARTLFYFVRDNIRYNLLVPCDKPEYFRASRILEAGEGFCIQKAVLYAAMARCAGIPTRLCLAAIRNHLIPDKLKDLVGGDIFPTHGYNEIHIEGKWIKVAPTFNLTLCQRNRFIPVEFDGVHDAILPSKNLDGKQHIEYVTHYGNYDDMPFDRMIALRIEALGPGFFDRINRAIEEKKRETAK